MNDKLRGMLLGSLLPMPWPLARTGYMTWIRLRISLEI